jgi:hypothetical protein
MARNNVRTGAPMPPNSVRTGTAIVRGGVWRGAMLAGSGRWHGRKRVRTGAWRGVPALQERTPKERALQEQAPPELVARAKRRHANETFAQVLTSSVSFGIALDGPTGLRPQLATGNEAAPISNTSGSGHSRDSCAAAIVIESSYPRRFAPAGSRRGGSRLPIGGRNHFLTLKCRKSGGGWFFLIGIKLPSAPSIYCSLPMNTSLRSSVQLFSVHITVGKRV